MFFRSRLEKFSHPSWRQLRYQTWWWLFARMIPLLLIGLMGGFYSHARRPVEKIKVRSELRTELNALLKASVELQSVSYKRKGLVAQDVAIRQVLSRLKLTQKKAHYAQQQSTHLIKIIQAVRFNLEKARKAKGSLRNSFFQKAFAQLVLVARVYQLDSYKIFFCPKDKSVWIQRGLQPQNPIHPETLGHCGKLVS